MSVLAVVAARNEAGYIATTLQALIDEGVEVAFIDHGSIDGTRELASDLLGNGLIALVDLQWRGVFDLHEQLVAKHKLYEQYQHDWFMHVDADEWPRALEDLSLESLLMEEVGPEQLVVNFREYVFVPPRGVDMWKEDFRQIASTYYFFEPRARRLMRAWRRSLVSTNLDDAGHTFLDLPDSAIYPEDQTLRHYIGLSWSHAITRRADRVYSKDDLAVGWHGNRHDMRTAPDLAAPVFKTATPWDARRLDDSAPSRLHFWEPGFSADALSTVGTTGPGDQDARSGDAQS